MSKNARTGFKYHFRHFEHFLDVAVRDFRNVGTLFPSSPWGARAVLRHLPSPDKTIVEYGGGDGTLTEYLLDAIANESRLWCVEVNASFANDLRKIQDPRLKVFHEDVRKFAPRMRELEANGVDAVISGIPFSFLAPAERDKVIQKTYDGLRPGGKFIVYQFSPRLRERMAKIFGNCSLDFEPRNFFPLFIMVATKN